MSGQVRAAAIVLAAGASQRMGAPKSLVDWGGRPLLIHQLETLTAEPAVAVIVVVSGHGRYAVERTVANWRARRPGVDLRVRFNPAHASGKASSVRAGVQAAPPRRPLLFVAVDQPLPVGVVGELWRALIARDRVAVPSYAGRRGHPVLFGAALRRELLAVDEASEGLKAVRRRDPARVQEVPVAQAGVHWNLNSPEALARARSEASP